MGNSSNKANNFNQFDQIIDNIPNAYRRDGRRNGTIHPTTSNIRRNSTNINKPNISEISINKLILKTQDEARYGKIVHSGYIRKLSKGRIWVLRFAVLWEDCALRFYENESRGPVIGKIKTKGVSEVIVMSAEQSILYDPLKPYFFSIKSNRLNKIWRFGVDDLDILNEWISILKAAFYVKKRMTLENLVKLCKSRNLIRYRENLLVYGYIGEFMKMYNDSIYIHDSLINLIEKKFFHDDKYDIFHERIDIFMNELSTLSNDKDMDDFMEMDGFSNTLRLLLNKKGFQNVWKNRMQTIIKESFKSDDKRGDYLCLLGDFGDIKIKFYCDICEIGMEPSETCKFWKCGHSFCASCLKDIIAISRKCEICGIDCDPEQFCLYSIQLRRR